MSIEATIQVNIEEHYKQCVIALQNIAQLADTGSVLHKERFPANGEGDGVVSGWRVAEAMREIAEDVSLQLSFFANGGRVRTTPGPGPGHYATVKYVIGNDIGKEATYYGIKLHINEKQVVYCEEERGGNPMNTAPVLKGKFSAGLQAGDGVDGETVHSSQDDCTRDG